MRILCLGVNHKTANVALREKLAFDRAGARAALADLADRWGESEFLIVSTCNRTEIYVARPVHGHPRMEELREWLVAYRSLPADEMAGAAYSLDNLDAVRHAFEVASGLDSLVPGEDQIVSQMKEAYEEAGQTGTTGPVLSEMFQTALHVAKHVRTETDFGAGKVSVASVAVDFVSRVFESLHGKCVLNVGAGKMNRLMLRQLTEQGADRLLVANRSKDKADALARACGGQVVAFEDLADRLAEADVVLTSTGADSCILTRAMLARAQERRGWRPMLLVDIAVPRDVEAEAGELENVFLYNIDDLDSIVRKTIRMRNGQRTLAERIIEEHVDELMARLEVRDVAPTIDALYRLMERVVEEEIQGARNKLSTHDDAEEDLAILQRALHRAIRRFLHPCTARLRESAGTPAAGAHVAAIRKLFELDRREE